MGRISRRLNKQAAERAASFSALSRLLVYAKREALALNQPIAANLIADAIAALLQRPPCEVVDLHGAPEIDAATKH
jgi:hypothetical protein